MCRQCCYFNLYDDITTISSTRWPVDNVFCIVVCWQMLTMGNNLVYMLALYVDLLIIAFVCRHCWYQSVCWRHDSIVIMMTWQFSLYDGIIIYWYICRRTCWQLRPYVDMLALLICMQTSFMLTIVSLCWHIGNSACIVACW